MNNQDRKEINDLIAKYDGNPIIIDCCHTIRYNSHDDVWSAVYDVHKLLTLDDYELGYVCDIIKSALKNGKSITIYSSTKYSFRDIDGWYSSAIADVIPIGAVVIEVDIITDNTN